MKQLTVVGLGPGGPQGLTAQAQEALGEADLICGYTGYIDLIREYYPDKELLSTPMTQEIARCRAALEAARPRPPGGHGHAAGILASTGWLAPHPGTGGGGIPPGWKWKSSPE